MGTGEITRFPHHPQGGFTLVETLTTLAIASILLTAAIPSMQDFIIRNRMSSEVNTFIASLYLARSEAVKRLQKVILCPVNSSGDCDTGNDDWEHGWKVYYTDIATGTDVVLQQNPALPSRFTFGGSHNNITYNPIGQANAGNYTFCDTDHVVQSRKVVLSSDGRLYVVKLSTSDC